MYLICVGGMGNVYLDESTDLEAHQQVVVKIMNTGYLSNSLRQRFDLERKILSRLNHPHITRIYDGGITEQGLPYIVMEYFFFQAEDGIRDLYVTGVQTCALPI